MKYTVSLLFLTYLLGGCTFVLWEPPTRTYLIPRGAHYPLQPVGTRLYTSPTLLCLTATFDTSCRYNIGPDQTDWNKLWGYGFIGSADQGLKPPQQVDSFRFGWRYNPDTDLVEIGAYVYDRGTRQPDRLLTTVPLNVPVELTLHIDYAARTYTANQTVIPFTHGKQVAFVCGPYFGGNQTAPHHITIQITN